MSSDRIASLNALLYVTRRTSNCLALEDGADRLSWNVRTNYKLTTHNISEEGRACNYTATEAGNLAAPLNVQIRNELRTYIVAGRGNCVDVLTRWRAGWSIICVSIPGRGKASGQAMGATQHRSPQVSGTLLSMKWSEREASQPTIYSAKVKNAWHCYFMPQ